MSVVGDLKTTVVPQELLFTNHGEELSKSEKRRLFYSAILVEDRYRIECIRWCTLYFPVCLFMWVPPGSQAYIGLDYPACIW